MTEDVRQEQKINWYPGHMAKARRELQEQLKRCDAVVELCDARIPRSSRNPILRGMAAGRSRVLVLGKSDLADPAETAKWLKVYAAEGCICLDADISRKGKKILDAVNAAARDAVERAAQRGIRKTVRAVVVGVPNVGKSTLINQLSGGKQAQVGDRPGVTKNNHWIRVSPYLELLDTPGLLWPRLDDPRCARRLAYTSAIRDEVVDTFALAQDLLADLIELVPERVGERFRVKDLTLRGQELLEAVCLGRGFLLKGGVPDLDRCCAAVLDEYRAGKLGRITLEPCGTEGWENGQE